MLHNILPEDKYMENFVKLQNITKIYKMAKWRYVRQMESISPLIRVSLS